MEIEHYHDKKGRYRPMDDTALLIIIGTCHTLFDESLPNIDGANGIDQRVFAACHYLGSLHEEESRLAYNLGSQDGNYVPAIPRVYSASPLPPGPASAIEIVIACDDILDDYGVAIGDHYTLQGRVHWLITCILSAQERIPEWKNAIKEKWGE